MFTLHFASFTGLSHRPVKYEDETDLRCDIADRLRRLRRRGFACRALTRGWEWEIGEPEDSVMVPDAAGILWVTERREDENNSCDYS